MASLIMQTPLSQGAPQATCLNGYRLSVPREESAENPHEGAGSHLLFEGLVGVMMLYYTYPTDDDINPALPSWPETMGIMVYSSLWMMQDIYHQP